MSYYVYAEQIGNRIFHRYVGDDGLHHSEVLNGFPIKLYVKGRKTPLSTVGLMGEVLYPIEFTDIADAKEFIKENKKTQEVYGQTDLLYQFLNHRYQNNITFDITKIRILAIDIETAYDDSGFPEPSKANQSILSISCKIFGKSEQFVVFGMKPYSKGDCKYVLCSDEKELLSRFQKYWLTIAKPDIVTGWNVEQFDIPYIINRSRKIMGTEFTNKFCPWHTDKTLTRYEKCIIPHEIGDNPNCYKITGITILDYLFLYKKYSNTSLEAYRLEVVAQHELQTGKVNYDEYDGLMGLYEQNFDLFIKYNMMDVELIERLEENLNFIFLAVTIAYLGNICYEDITSQVKFWDTYIYNRLQHMGIQIPPKQNKEQEEIVGGYVKDPIPALYRWVATLDLTSLYPSIIMSFNLSPETHIGSASDTINEIEDYISKTKDLSWAKEQNVCVLANGSTYTREKDGVFATLTKEMFGQRKAAKKRAIQLSQQFEQMKDASEEERNLIKSEEKIFNAKQNALKIALNSLYGASANRYFRYNNKDIAEGITLTGQVIIRHISNELNAYLNTLFKTQGIDYIIFNDTDSAGLNLQRLVDMVFKEDQSDKNKIINFMDNFVKAYIMPFLDKKFSELTEFFNAKENLISMKREVLADCGLWRGKKNYLLQMWDKEGIRYSESKLKAVGIETAKSSIPKVVRGALEKALRIILNGKESDLHEYVKTVRDSFEHSPVSEIAFPRGVNDLSKWMTPGASGIPIQTNGSILYNKLLHEKGLANTHPEIKNGDKVKFVYLVPANPTRNHVISFLDEIPKEFDIAQYVDRNTQFEKSFCTPLTSFLKIVGWSIEPTFSVDDFFS